MAKSNISVIYTDNTNVVIEVFLKGVYVHVTAWNYDCRSSWGHKAKILVGLDKPTGYVSEYAEAKIVYYNRTWECYRFESVIHSALTKVLEKLHEAGNAKLYKRIMKAIERLAKPRL